jgi:hypothetical protein
MGETSTLFDVFPTTQETLKGRCKLRMNNL